MPVDTNTIYNEGCFVTFKRIGDKSIDSIVTDPPYELGFMSKAWDKTGIAYNVDLWREVLRVLKPGGHLLSFGGTRTFHRIACAIEDAGFEIRDTVMWLYGQGFPKSLDISKAIDKKAGKLKTQSKGFITAGHDGRKAEMKQALGYRSDYGYQYNPSTPEAKQWEGWGTGLKPAFEPIILARKPISEKTIAENVLKWGTGAINIDASRIQVDNRDPNHRPNPSLSNQGANSMFGSGGHSSDTLNSQGRFPANVIHDSSDEVLAVFPITKSGKVKEGYKRHTNSQFIQGNESQLTGFGDTGTTARFFYCAKASRAERDAGLEGMNKGEAQSRYGLGDSGGIRAPHENKPQVNNHPTVKPLALMRYLIKLITPPNGIILDPFCGSGSTLVAAKQLDYNYIGCELDKGYYDICIKRIEEHNVELE